MALPTASDNPFPSLLVTEGSAPSSPAAGKQRVYIDTADHKLKRKDSGGTVTIIESAAGADGWTAIPATLTYSSADGPTGVATTSVDLTGSISVGMRVKLTQTTVKYFIVTAITATTITLYGGTDYTLANAAITLPFYSAVKAPLGFPMDPLKWTVTVTDTSNQQQTSPVSGTWYNLGSLQISVPIGAWLVSWSATLNVTRPTTGGIDNNATLSTANNTESDGTMTALSYMNSGIQFQTHLTRSKHITVAAKTTYFLNSKTTNASMTAISFNGTQGTTVIKAVCAYL